MRHSPDGEVVEYFGVRHQDVAELVEGDLSVAVFVGVVEQRQRDGVEHVVGRSEHADRGACRQHRPHLGRVDAPGLCRTEKSLC